MNKKIILSLLVVLFFLFFSDVSAKLDLGELNPTTSNLIPLPGDRGDLLQMPNGSLLYAYTYGYNVYSAISNNGGETWFSKQLTFYSGKIDDWRAMGTTVYMFNNSTYGIEYALTPPYRGDSIDFAIWSSDGVKWSKPNKVIISKYFEPYKNEQFIELEVYGGPNSTIIASNNLTYWKRIGYLNSTECYAIIRDGTEFLCYGQEYKDGNTQYPLKRGIFSSRDLFHWEFKNGSYPWSKLSWPGAGFVLTTSSKLTIFAIDDWMGSGIYFSISYNNRVWSNLFTIYPARNGDIVPRLIELQNGSYILEFVRGYHSVMVYFDLSDLLPTFPRDNPPTIFHEPIRERIPLIYSFAANVSDDIQVCEVVFNYKYRDETNNYKIPMEKYPQTEYVGMITFPRSGYVEYQIVARDCNGSYGYYPEDGTAWINVTVFNEKFPLIEIEYPPIAYKNKEIQIQAKVSSDINLQRVTLWYKVENIGNNGSIEMILINGTTISGTWEATLPPQSYEATIYFFITATDGINTKKTENCTIQVLREPKVPGNNNITIGFFIVIGIMTIPIILVYLRKYLRKEKK